METTPLLWSNSVKNAGQCTETEKTGSDLNAIEDHVKPSKKQCCCSYHLHLIRCRSQGFATAMPHHATGKEMAERGGMAAWQLGSRTFTAKVSEISRP